jgi:hypothetical protein
MVHPQRPHRWSLRLVIALLTTVVTVVYLLALAPSTLVASPAGGGAVQLFEANLTGTEEVPAVNTGASGRAVFALSEDLTTLHYRVMVHDISNITMAHIHEAPFGVNGPVVHWLTPQPPNDPILAPGSPVSGSITLAEGQLQDLLDGNYYVNVHTTAYPGGEIRGQIRPFTPPSDLSALLVPDEEVHDVVSDAVGVARFTLVAPNMLEYEVEVANIENVTMSHIHRAPRGVNGPVVHWLTPQPPDDPILGPGSPVSGSLTLDADDMVDLFTGWYYVNVHTTAYGAGEIRGQIGSAHVFRAPLSGAEEVPPVDTAASGDSMFGLSGDASRLYYRVMVQDIENVTMAHIHRAPRGVNGSVVYWLTPQPPNDPVLAPGSPVSGVIDVTTADVFDLLGENFYVNVHTTSYPGGEIRGQIERFETPAHYRAPLSPAEEVPPVQGSDASGLARFTLDRATGVLHYRVDVSDIDNITMAHIHRAPRGVNGGVIHWLFGNGQQVVFGPENPAGGGVMLNAEHLVDLLTEYSYVNVHTTEFPGGEIRGQIVPVDDDPTSIVVGGMSATNVLQPVALALAVVGLSLTVGLAAARRRRAA